MNRNAMKNLCKTLPRTTVTLCAVKKAICQLLSGDGRGTTKKINIVYAMDGMAWSGRQQNRTGRKE